MGKASGWFFRHEMSDLLRLIALGNSHLCAHNSTCNLIFVSAIHLRSASFRGEAYNVIPFPFIGYSSKVGGFAHLIRVWAYTHVRRLIPSLHCRLHAFFARCKESRVVCTSVLLVVVYKAVPIPIFYRYRYRYQRYRYRINRRYARPIL